jgi:hypothetical protein
MAVQAIPQEPHSVAAPRPRLTSGAESCGGCSAKSHTEHAGISDTIIQFAVLRIKRKLTTQQTRYASKMQATNIDQVIAALASLIEDFKAQDSRLGFFAALYRQVTFEVQRGIERGFFDNGPRMDRFDTIFANRYLAALDAFQSGGTPTRSWKVAFTAMEQPQEIILQDLLVGINAHINLDLGIAAAQVAPGDAIQGLKGDFDKINQILAALIQGVEAVISRFSPLIGLLEKVGGKDAAEVLNFSLDAARQDAWTHAVILAHQGPALQALTIEALDGKVSFLGRLIANPVGLVGKAVDLIRQTESDDVEAVIDALNSVVH